MTTKIWKAHWSREMRSDVAENVILFLRDHSKGSVVSDGKHWYFKTSLSEITIREHAVPAELLEVTEEEYDDACTRMFKLMQDMEDEYRQTLTKRKDGTC